MQRSDYLVSGNGTVYPVGPASRSRVKRLKSALMGAPATVPGLPRQEPKRAAPHMLLGMTALSGVIFSYAPAAAQNVGDGTYVVTKTPAGDRGGDGQPGSSWGLGCSDTPTSGKTGTSAGAATDTVNTIQTSGNGLARITSTGGRGGDGGNNITTGRCGEDAGNGGNGGSGAAVTTTIDYGNEFRAGATAVVAVSTGGKGGDGGRNNNSGKNGGTGGTGGVGGLVTLTNNRGLNTTTADSYALYAQSVGGRGGNGGGTDGLIWGGNGGGAGAAGAGGAVMVTNNGRLFTERSTALFAQSIGGSGGAGGFSYGTLAGGNAAGGGYGGAGGSVFVENNGGIYVNGTGSEGIFAQSVGGGGGRGGSSAGAVAIGANGGPAGNGAAVTVINRGEIFGRGASNTGIFAQSIGGGGGSGGLAFGSSIYTVAIGGSGGKGGVGGTVFVDNIGLICTGSACETNTAPAGSGGQAHGIFAQSIGGGGGSGGFGGTALLVGRSVSVGGTGGDGGAGGFVSVINAGSIKTNERQSTGIFAQSVGGGGGVAGGSVALNAGGNASSTTIGGTGGEGGAGGMVAVNCMAGSALSGRNLACTNAGKLSGTNGSTINTRGDNSQAIFAQSVGGGGGAGGLAVTLSAAQNVVTETTGGSGAKGGSGGAVYAGTAGTKLETLGNNSAGLFAQSIGGGGGTGGSSVNTTFAVTSFGTSFGGSGNGGGAGGSVMAENQGGRITTRGDNSAGIFAQSVGGGGGNGGLSVTSGAAIAKLDVSFGGNAGGGNNGGAVVVSNTGSITTGAGGTGRNSAAILAQSIGGGGGNGGGVVNGGLPTSGSNGSFALIAAFGGKAGGGGTGGNGGTVAVNCFVGPASKAADSDACATPYGAERPSSALSTSEILSTNGDYSNGILAQSIGGGGGNGGYTSNISAALGANVSATFGGSGAAGGAGGTVYANTAGMAINTSGANSAALLAQSIGGGGGNGGSTLSGTFGGAFDLSATFGGRGAGGQAGGAVLVENFGGALRTGGANSAAIMAQSIGGGGGNGGNAINVGAAGGMSAKASFGGLGGAGATGGTVKVNNIFGLNSLNSGLTTSGANSHALIAQSIGGGGGNGGDALTVGAGGVGSIALAFGGAGGTGGTGGNVSVVSENARYNTSGADAKGVAAQSIGGGGGTGGSSISIGLSSIGSAALSFGGTGGTGGRAGQVDVALSGGSVTTAGARADGVLAQSIGGSGGSGGASIAGAGSIAGVALGLSMGGSGGTGGIGGDVRVANLAKDGASAASISTSGFQASGITAQSIGGNGGQGGFSVAGVASLGGGGAAAVSIGGTGGAGGKSGVIVVDNEGSITGSGGGSALITAQSIGGSGGSGGFSVSGALAYGNSAAISIGGGGGEGGIANIVTVTNSGKISSSANKVNSGGILAQSIGGGGGSGGFSVAGAISAMGSVGVSIGGEGAGGGRGLAVKVNNFGTIETVGELSHGIQAQSIGGKGGSGGFSVAGSLSQGTGVAVGVGGSGGSGGIAESVLVEQHLDYGEILLTKGTGSSAIIAQSIGGSGGTSGFSVAAGVGGVGAVGVSIGGNGGTGGTSGAVTVKATGAGEIKTLGTNAIAILAQSIGGSGGNASFSAAGGASSTLTGTSNVGGLGGDGGKADAVSVTLGSILRTEGDLATGILAQSIGGNGGTGGDAISGSLALGNPKLAVGGAGSGAGKGGKGSTSADVTVTTNAGSLIDTRGQKAIGIIAQSIGGNGGDGGSAYAYSVATSSGSDDSSGGSKKPKSGAASVAVGGNGGGGGNGGQVTILLGGNITTASSLSVGVLAQSIGGSGGNGGMASSKAIGGDASASVSVGGGGGDAGNAGLVKLTNNGSITTQGAMSEGVKAQSIGGGGGAGGSADSEALSNRFAASVSVGGYGGGGGKGGEVVLDHTGSITTYGSMSSAIFAQSVGGGGGNGGAAISAATGKADTVPTTGSGSKAGKGKSKISGASTASSSLPGATTKPGAATGGAGGKAAGEDEEPDDGIAGALSLGGSGGLASEGGSVNVTASGQIQTYGAQSHGIFAQSVGGGGGSGGMATTNAEGGKAAGAVSLGGTGAGGATGGAVTVTSTANILTGGLGSTALFAQSIGGGGGNGGSTESTAKGGKGAISFGLGGEGGGAGDGGAVTVTSSGTLTSTGVGIFAQSIGGGGGNGGSVKSAATASDEDEEDEEEEKKEEEGEDAKGKWDVAAVSGALAGYQSEIKADKQNRANAANRPSAANPSAAGENGAESGADGGFAVGLSLGGSGGAGGNGGAVNVTANGSVTTSQNASANSHAIFAQSIGGGGGNAGEAATNTSTTMGSFALALGGSGGKGGKGGAVTVTAKNSVTTYAGISSAIFAQSVGGGGGNGGAVETTLGDGGKAALAFSMGGTGGDGGAGGDVKVDSVAALTTSGALSHALFAQSVGGGGGSGGSVVASKEAKDVDLEKSAGEALAKAEKGEQVAEVEAGFAMSIGLGGTGGGGGGGGKVTITSSGAINTSGAGAAGVFAQSVGGGGGSSGAVTINSDEGEAAIGLALGASGGKGGAGGNVDVTAASVRTTADLAYGVFAQSVGGGGGNSSTVNATSAGGGGMKVNFALGSSGGAGSAGGNVTVKTTGSIETAGLGATGILAHSVGGGGGAAGSSLSSAKVGSVALALSMGSGGDGGNGGVVDLTVGGNVKTTGHNAAAVLVQSIGGGGGLGSVSETSVALKGAQKPTTLFSLGNAGGGGGSAGVVKVAIQADTASGSRYFINTGGDNAPGLLAQSVGGGGGATLGLTRPEAPASSLMATMTLGGANGSWVFGEDVTSNVRGAYINTSGANSAGIVLQSIGAGGGFSASSDVANTAIEWNASLGRVGDRYAQYKTGNVTHTSSLTSITTNGPNASALIVQAISGGGGVAVQTVLARDSNYSSGPVTKPTVSGRVSLGAYGLSASGNVSVTSTDESLSTQGALSFGILAQSITGGGGLATLAMQEAWPSNPAQSFTGNLDMGANVTSTANAGNVKLNLTNIQISTNGVQSSGVVAQSIAGGGGVSGFFGGYQTQGFSWNLARLGSSYGISGGAGGNVTIDATGSISIYDSEGTVGLLAQSIGGGGGFSSTPALGLTLGGVKGVSTPGGTVTINSTPSIYVRYASQTGQVGIIAQSIGGGGGVGYFKNYAYLGGSGFGSAPANGGAVTLNVTSEVRMDSAASIGVFAQSVGGGGGLAINPFGDSSYAYLTPSLGQGGSVTVTVNAPITMTGVNSIGLVAQSVSNGGGVVLSRSGVRFYSGVEGSAGTVKVVVKKDIIATGKGSKAIEIRSGSNYVNPTTSSTGARSLASAAVPDTASALAAVRTADTVTPLDATAENAVLVAEAVPVATGGRLDSTGVELRDGSARVAIGDITTAAALDPTGGAAVSDGSGIYPVNAITDDVMMLASASAPDTARDLAVRTLDLTAQLDETAAEDNEVLIAEGVRVIGGSGPEGTGIELGDGNVRVVIERGAIVASLDRTEGGTAIHGGANGSVTLVNNGVIGGDIELLGSGNRFTNSADAMMVTYGRLALGADGLFTNSGTIAPGDYGTLQTTTVTGGFAQSATGLLDTDLNLALLPSGQFTDRLDATGTGRIGGTVRVLETNVETIRAGDWSSVLVSGAGGVTNDGAKLVAPQSAVAAFSFGTTATQFRLNADVDFATPGRTLNVNRTATGDYVNRIQDAGSATALADTVRALFYTPNAAALAAVYDTYNGDIYADQLGAATYAADRFSARMTGCRTGGAVSDNGCAWLSAGTVNFRQNATAQDFRFQEDGTVFQAGLEHRLGQSDFFAGISGGYEKVTSYTNGASGKGDRYLAGLIVGWRPGNAEIALYGSLGEGNIDIVRPVAAPGGMLIAKGRQKFDFGQFGGIAGYRFDLGDVVVRPSVEAGYMRYGRGGSTENGAGALSLIAQSGTSDQVGFVRPQVAVTSVFDIGSLRIEPHLSAGYTRRFTDRVTFLSKFAGAPSGAAAMSTASFLDRDSGTLSAGISAVTPGGVRISGEYGATFGGRTFDQSLQAKVSIAF